MLSPYIMAIIAAWVAAQGAKYIIAVVKSGTLRNFRQLYVSGNMPSAHSASVIALVVMVAGLNGTEGGLFALTALFAAIVMYDAMMVRRSSGEQGAALTELLANSKLAKTIRLPRVAKGHTPVEVAVGALLGMVVGLVVLTITNA
jgi:acid phosphatase family membrane protein YuiD